MSEIYLKELEKVDIGKLVKNERKGIVTSNLLYGSLDENEPLVWLGAITKGHCDVLLGINPETLTLKERIDIDTDKTGISLRPWANLSGVYDKHFYQSQGEDVVRFNRTLEKKTIITEGLFPNKEAYSNGIVSPDGILILYLKLQENPQALSATLESKVASPKERTDIYFEAIRKAKVYINSYDLKQKPLTHTTI